MKYGWDVSSPPGMLAGETEPSYESKYHERKIDDANAQIDQTKPGVLYYLTRTKLQHYAAKEAYDENL